MCAAATLWTDYLMMNCDYRSKRNRPNSPLFVFVSNLDSTKLHRGQEMIQVYDNIIKMNLLQIFLARNAERGPVDLIDE